MTFDIFKGRGDQLSATTVPPGSSGGTLDIDPADYVADDALADAVNVALLLQQPLLLTGEPGTGKTQLAYRVAWELGLDEPLKFETKANSQSRDLFYIYDALGRFQARDTGAGSDALPFIRFGGLGIAVLLASDKEADRQLLGRDAGPPRRSVVLIDEIDKAPRDFPNDILNEINLFYFRIPELGNREVRAPRERRPIVIITSNSEKDLPDAFLRRCVFYHINFPSPERLQDIVMRHLGKSVAVDGFLSEAIALFAKIRDGQLRKKPATAELLGWLIALRRIAPDVSVNPMARREDVERTMSTLVKTVEDQEEVGRIVATWYKTR